MTGVFFGFLEEVLKSPVEEGAGPDPRKLPAVCFCFRIKPAGNWLVDLRSPGSPSIILWNEVEHATAASCTIDTSESDFLTLLRSRSRIEAFRMLTSGRVRTQGDRSLLAALNPFLREALKRMEEAANPNPARQRLAGAASPVKSIFLDRKAWTPDSVVNACTSCASSFGLFRRKHHCRVCGEIFCHSCSNYRLDNERACHQCWDAWHMRRKQRASFSVQRAASATGGSSQSDRKPSMSGAAAPGSESGLLRREYQDTLDAFHAEQVTADLPATSSSSSTAQTSDGPFPTESQRQTLEEKLAALERHSANANQRLCCWAMLVAIVSALVTAAAFSFFFLQSPLIPPAAHQYAAKLSLTVQTWWSDTLIPWVSEHLSKLQTSPHYQTAHAYGVKVYQYLSSRFPQDSFEYYLSWGSASVNDGIRQLSEIQWSWETLQTVQTVVIAWVVAHPVWSALLAVCSMVFFFIQFLSGPYLRRRMLIYQTTLRVMLGFQWVKYSNRWFRRSETAANEQWEKAHLKYAPLVYRTIVRLEGVWVKVGQYLSSRADIMPDEWIKELSKLQDAVPARPLKEVEATIRRNFNGQGVSDLFDGFDPVPIAAASVAQVHVARLKKDGRKVVIKVQHQSVPKLWPADMINLERILSWVAYIEPDFDFRPIVREWGKETAKELDFRHEAENMRRVSRNLSNAGIDVIIPKIVDELIGEQVLVMEFCEGFKITDTALLDQYGVDREALVRKVCQAFAHQIYMDGFFNADPHPGNILVQVTRQQTTTASGKDRLIVKPVLLDFGLTKALEPSLQRAFAQMVGSVSDMDYGGLLGSFDAMGLKLKREDPGQDMQSIRFVLRDTAPPSEMRADTMKFQQKRMEERKKLPRALRNPVDSWPGELLFFFRVTFLLRGLCSALHVRLPYLQILAPYAKLALIDSVPRSLHAVREVGASAPCSSLDMKVRELLTELFRARQITGAQVCVYSRGKKVVDACAGVMGASDPRPVQPDTLFNCFSVTKGVLAVLAHMEADAGKLRWDAAVSRYWPEFAVNGKSTCTVAQLLSHQAGLESCVNGRAPLTELTDWDKMLDKVANATPTTAPGTKAAYHILSFGWLVGGLLQKISNGTHPRDLLRRQLARPLGLEEDMFFGFTPEQLEQQQSRIATLCNGFGRDYNPPTAEELKEMAEQFRAMRARREQQQEAAKAAGTEGLPDAPTPASGDDQVEDMLGGNLSLMDPCVFNTKAVRTACLPAANGHFTARALAKVLGALAYEGQMDGVRIASPTTIRNMTIPLAKESRSGFAFMGQSSSSSSDEDNAVLNVHWGLGFHLYRGGPAATAVNAAAATPARSAPSTPSSSYSSRSFASSSAAASPAVRRVLDFSTTVPSSSSSSSSATGPAASSSSSLPWAFGHPGLGGSYVFCDPATGVSVAVTLNKLTLAREATARIVALVCEELGVRGPPIEL